MPKRSRRVDGLFPWVGGRILALGSWSLRHPQPLLALVFLLAAVWALIASAQRADAFRITQVSLSDDTSLTLPDPLIGTNLWRLDIRALSDRLERQQPSLKQVRVVRQLPNTIRIEAIPRVPVAQVRLDQWYPVDAEGFVLPQGSVGPAEGLIRIIGFERAPATLKAGTLHHDERLALALRVLHQLQEASRAIARRVSEINVENPRQLRFILDGALEVRCGNETELSTQWERLKAALKMIERQGLSVEYIDLRFPELVVGPDRG